MYGVLASDTLQVSVLDCDSWLIRALSRRAAEGVVDPEAAVAAFNSSL